MSNEPCKSKNHVCCPLGYYLSVFMVIDETKQEVVKQFTCLLKAKKYAKRNNLWLIQELKLDKNIPRDWGDT